MGNESSVVTFSQVKTALKNAGEEGLSLNTLRHLLKQKLSERQDFDEDRFDTSFNIIFRDLVGKGEVVWTDGSTVTLRELQELARIPSC